MGTTSVLSAFGESPTLMATALTTALASLLTSKVYAVGFNAADVDRTGGSDLSVLLSYSAGGSTMSAPYQAIALGARTAAEAAAQAQALIAATPGNFWSGVFAGYLKTAGRRTAPYVFLIFTCTDATNGALNWLVDGSNSGGGGGGPTGPAGGDLTGTYPDPTLTPLWQQADGGPLAVATDTILTVAAATYGDIDVQLELVKGTARYSTLVRMTSDGTTAQHTESDVTVAPPAGTFDFTIDVVLSAGNFLLQITPLSTGWYYRIRPRRLAA